MICAAQGAITFKKNRRLRILVSTATINANGNAHGIVAIWDTGATKSVISPVVANVLGLSPIRTAVASSASDQKTCNVYKIDLVINPSLRFCDVEVLEMDIHKQNGSPDMLIGMDILCNGDFSVTHLNGETWFSFRVPSQEHIDYSAPVQ